MTGNSRIMGYIYAIASAASLGVIPLFYIPLQKSGISADTLLAYRFGVGALWLAPLARFGGVSFKISAGQMIAVALIGVTFMLSTYFLFYALLYVPSSVAVPLLYLYPVMVMFIMLFFGEKFSMRYVLVLGMVLLGVTLLSEGPTDCPDAGAAATYSLPGIFLALGAGLCMALLNVSLKVSRVSSMDGIALTFYLLVISCIYTVAQSFFTEPVQWVGDLPRLGVLIIFAFITAVLPNVFLIWAIQIVGPTLASILGVIQPLTSVFCGILVFGDPVSFNLFLGIFIVVAAVLLAILKPRGV